MSKGNHFFISPKIIGEIREKQDRETRRRIVSNMIEMMIKNYEEKKERKRYKELIPIQELVE